MISKKLLIVLPRAVDLSLFCAGTAAKLAKNGWIVNFIAAGADQRDAEKSQLFAAGKIIGINNVFILKNTTHDLKKIGIDNLKMAIFEIFEEVKPDVVITIARHGFSQNPNYALVSRAATLAYEKYSNNVISAQIPTPKLYFFCLPQQFITFIQSKGFLRKDVYGYNFEGTPDKNITHVINFKNRVKQKIAALKIYTASNIIEASRMIELLKTYKSSWNDYYALYGSGETKSISSRL